MSQRPDTPPDPLPIARFDYELPEDLIAQAPVEPRDASRLLVVDRATGHLSDHIFRELPTLLDPGDLLVVNDTRVLRARLMARRRTGGRVEILLLRKTGERVWRALARPAGRLRPGEMLDLLDVRNEPTGEQVEFLGREGGEALVALPTDDVIELYGRIPLPPYIRRQIDDPERYQTVFAYKEGSSAAPTAGLHFTPELLECCRERGIVIGSVTLHVGLDTFQPVTEEDALRHKIHAEWYHVPVETLELIRAAKIAGKRVVAVGTTAVRTLESVADRLDSAEPITGWTSLYIVPRYEFAVVDAMITNFHLPRTTLLLLVSAFAGERLVRRAYEHAIKERYRFYSFGDAMLIL